VRLFANLRKDWTISALGHIAALAVGLFSFSGTKPPAQAAMEWMPVNIVADGEVSQMTRGQRDAQQPNPNQPAEKVAQAKPVEDLNTPIADKKPVKAPNETAPAPQVTPTPPTENKPTPTDTTDAIAETLAKEEPKKDEVKKPDPKKAEVKPPKPPKKPQPAPRFDPRQVEALLDKRTPTRMAAAGETPSAPALGVQNAHATQLSLSELDAFRARLAQLWNPPEARNPDEVVCVFSIKLKRDGTIDGWPTLVSSGKTPLGIAAREAAARALNRGQPYDMFKPEHYELWKEIEVRFDPRDMVHG
jgi:colicin import membrane protein